MLLGKISINLPEHRFSQRKSKTFGRDCIEIAVQGVDVNDSIHETYKVYTREFDLHVMEVFKTSVRAAFPIVLYLTEAAVEISVELPDEEYLEIGIYERTDMCLLVALEILSGIRYENRPLGIDQTSLRVALGQYLTALEEDDAKNARKQDEAKKRGADVPGKHYVYDKDIAFDLPKGFEFFWKDLGDGEKGGRIITDISIDEDGDKRSGYMIVVEDGTARVPTAEFFEKAVAESLENASNASSCRLSHDPETVLYTSSTKMSIFGKVIETVDLTALVSISNSKLLRMAWSGGKEIAAPARSDLMEKMLNAVKAIRIHGSPISIGHLEARALWEKMYPREHDGPVHEIPLGIELEVKVDDKTVSRKTIAEPKRVTKEKNTASASEKSVGEKQPKEQRNEGIADDPKIQKQRRETAYCLKAIRGRYQGNLQAPSFDALKRDNPDIHWKELEDYLTRVQKMNASEYFMSVGVVKPGGNAPVTAAPPEESFVPVAEPMCVNGSLDMRGRTVIGKYECANNPETGELVIPEGVTEIGRGAFSCSRMKSIVLPKTLKCIEEWAFYDCKNLTEIRLPVGIKSFGNNVFEKCDSLADVYIPDDLASMLNYGRCFSGASSAPASHITFHLSNRLATALKWEEAELLQDLRHAGALAIDGQKYQSAEDYIRWRKTPEARAKREQADQEERMRKSREEISRIQEENRKKEQARLDQERRALEEQRRKEQERLAREEQRRREQERREQEEQKRLIRERRERAVREQERIRSEQERQAAEEQKQWQRIAIQKQIEALESDRDAAMGILGFVKRSKIQSQIDALKEELKKI